MQLDKQTNIIITNMQEVKGGKRKEKEEKGYNPLWLLYLVLCMLVSGRVLVVVGILAAHQACRSCRSGEIGLSANTPGGDARQR